MPPTPEGVNVENFDFVTLAVGLLGGGVGLQLIKSIFGRRGSNANIQISLTEAAEQYAINLTQQLDESRKATAELFVKFGELQTKLLVLEDETAKQRTQIEALQEEKEAITKKYNDLLVDHEALKVREAHLVARVIELENKSKDK